MQAPPSSSPKQRTHLLGSALLHAVAQNAVWNWAGLAVNTLVGFLLLPYLVHHLGQTGYGLWILIVSLTSYFSMLDMGVCAAVGRQVAFHLAKDDADGVNATFNTALAILLAAGLLAMTGTLLAMPLFFKLFSVPADQIAPVRTSLFLTGINLFLWLPLSMADAMLWAHQRFDVINLIDIPVALGRAVLTVALVGPRHGLVALAIIVLLAQSGSMALKALMVWHLNPSLRLSPRYLRRQAARQLLGMGFWNSLLQLIIVVNGQVGPAIVGSRVAVLMVTPFNIASRLIAYGRDFIVSGTGVLTPLVISFHAEDKHDKQQQLLLDGGRYATALAFLFVTIFLVLGQPIIRLWMHQDVPFASTALLLLILGEALPMSQWVSYSIILGKYHHRELAVASVIENAIAIALALIFVRHWGLLGVCVGFAIPATLCRGLFWLIYACRLVKVSPWRYGLSVLLPVLSAGLLPALTLWHVVHRSPPRTWPHLLMDVALYSLAYLASLALLFARAWYRRGQPRQADVPQLPDATTRALIGTLEAER
ncbi:MAG: lipopolysaccharide biosynthesis protein [Bacillota bacterium]